MRTFVLNTMNNMKFMNPTHLAMPTSFICKCCLALSTIHQYQFDRTAVSAHVIAFRRIFPSFWGANNSEVTAASADRALQELFDDAILPAINTYLGNQGGAGRPFQVTLLNLWATSSNQGGKYI